MILFQGIFRFSDFLVDFQFLDMNKQYLADSLQVGASAIVR